MLPGAKIKLVAIFFASIFSYGQTLNCSLCSTLISWEACDKSSDTWTCTDEIVLYEHNFLMELNPTLPLNKSSTNNQQYKCYNLELLFGVDKQVRGFTRGCTFAEVNFCSGWIDTTEVVNCSTCLSEDQSRCNGALSTLIGVGLWMNLFGIVVLMIGWL